MKKKVLKKKPQRKPSARKATAPAVESAREIWLAGLGALSVAQQESGRIIEMGSHRELIRSRGHYYNLYTKQFRQEAEERYQVDLTEIEPETA